MKAFSVSVAVLIALVCSVCGNSYATTLWLFDDVSSLDDTDELIVGSSVRSGVGVKNITWANLISDIISDIVADEAYSAANFNGDTTHAVSQDDLFDRLAVYDTDSDGSFADESWLTAKQDLLSNEAGLYSALSDVSKFYEPGDLLRTEAGNSPTTPSNDGEFVVDTDDEQLIVRVGGGNKTFDFSGDSSGYILKSNGSGIFTLAAESGSGTPNILDLADDDSNESTDLTEIAITNDTNSIFSEPSADKLLIDVSQNWPAADTATTANAGDSATAFFSAGTIEHERGGLEADVSAYSGLVKISGGSTSAVTTTTFAESILDDSDEATFKATTNLEIGTDVQAYDADLTTYGNIPPSSNIQTFLGAADYDAMQSQLAIDDIISLTGIAEGTANLGTFTGSTISDSTTIKAGMQELETAVEGIGTHNAVTLAADADNLLSLSTQEIGLDSQTANYFFAAPNGAGGDPVFRAIVDADVPNDITITESDPNALLTAGTDNIKDSHIDWGSGAGQVDMSDFPVTGSWSPTGTIDISGATVTFGLADGDIPTTLTLETISGTPVISNGARVGTDDTDHLIDDASNGAASSTLYIGNESILASGDIGVSVQGYDSDLATYAGITPSSDVQTMLGSANNAAIVSNIGAEADLSNEAGLYSALSDVSQFYEPGDILRTEAGNSPTTPSNDGEFVVDTDDEQLIVRVGGGNKTIDFSGDSSGYVLKSNGSGGFSLAAESGGGTANILDLADDDSNESSDLVEIAVSNDTNSIFSEPSADKLLVNCSNNWPTADTANTGDSATSFFSTGTIEHERGGLEADVSAYAGLVKISGGSTSAVTTTAFAESILDDTDEATFKSTVNLEIGTDIQAYDADLTTYGGITPSSDVQTMLGSADNAAIVSNIGAESDLSNEAGLYSALSDVSQFYEPGDLLRTESGNSPTTPSNDGEFVVDTDDEQLIVRVNGGNKTFDFSGDSSGYVLKSNGSGLFTLSADSVGGGGTANILDLADDGSNESSDLVEIAVANDTNSIFTEPAADKLLIDCSNNWPAADTATTANAGDSATAFFSTGTIEHERGGLEADVSAYSGLVKISGGSTSAVTATTFAESILDDSDEATFKATVNLEIGTDVQAYDADLSTYAGITPSSDIQTFLGAADYDAMQSQLAVDDIVSLTGIAEGTANLGTFTGSTISDSTTIKTAMQELETAVEAAGGGTANILDLADDDSNESTDLTEFAVTNDTNSIFSEPSADKLLINCSNNWPAADTATTATTANAGDSATAFFSAGTIEHERGGLEADVSAYAGLIKITGGTTSAVTATAFAESILDDSDEATFKATTNLEIGTDVQAYDADLTTYAGITPSANIQSFLGAADYDAMQSQLAVDDIVSLTGIAEGTANLGTFTGSTISDSTTIKTGMQELETALEALNNLSAANASEVNTGTSTTKAITPDALAGSTLGSFYVTIPVVATPDTALETGDGLNYWTVPPDIGALSPNLVSVFAAVYTVSSSGTPTFQVYNATDSQDMLSTALTIDASEYNSSTAATSAVINTSYDDVATGDRIRIDCDVAGTSTAGGEITLGFRIP